MAFRIYLGSFSKRVNSTARPDYSGWHSVEALWKRDTDLEAPTVELYLPDVESPTWNYMFIPSTKGYYWIDAIISTGAGRWTFTAHLDAMATYKDEILSTTAFIQYGFNLAPGDANTRLPDPRQALSAVPSITSTAVPSATDILDPVNGTFILCAVGKTGGVTAYALSHDMLEQLIDSIGKDIFDAVDALTDETEIWKYFTKNSLYQGTAIQAIRSCTWMPFKSSYYSGSLKPVYLGDFNTGVNAIAVGQNAYHRDATGVEIPWPSADWKRLNCQILVYIPLFGTYGVPVDQYNDSVGVAIARVYDLLSGSISLLMTDQKGVTIATGTAQVGIPYGIGTSNVPIQNVVGGTLTAVGGAIKTGVSLFAGGSTGIGDMVSGVERAITPILQGQGTLSGNASLGQDLNIRMNLLHYPPIDPDFAQKYGYPIMKVATPVAGYCKTQGFSVAAEAREEEINFINNTMDRGAYIE